MKLIDWDKPLTFQGATYTVVEFQVLKKDMGGTHPFLVAFKMPGSMLWRYLSYDEYGNVSTKATAYNIRNVVKTHVRYVNFYPVHCTSHGSRQHADHDASPRRLACKKIEFYDGEGIDEEDD